MAWKYPDWRFLTRALESLWKTENWRAISSVIPRHPTLFPENTGTGWRAHVGITERLAPPPPGCFECCACLFQVLSPFLLGVWKDPGLFTKFSKVCSDPPHPTQIKVCTLLVYRRTNARPWPYLAEIGTQGAGGIL